MPRDYHPCFRDQLWEPPNKCTLLFDSDGHEYFYRNVPPAIYAEFGDGSLTGGPWNRFVRANIGVFTRLH